MPPRNCGGRLKADDLTTLCEYKRHFLGLWTDPSITLGTELSDVSKVGWSQAPNMRQETTREGRRILKLSESTQSKLNRVLQGRTEPEESICGRCRQLPKQTPRNEECTCVTYLRKDEITTVLFDEGLQDPILSSRKSRSNRDFPSRNWSSIPAGFSILTASLPCLRNACEQFNSDLGYSSEGRSRGDTADWRSPRPPRKRSEMRNRDSIELGEEDTGRENRLQVARRPTKACHSQVALVTQANATEKESSTAES